LLPHFPIEEVRQDLMTDAGRLARACHLKVRLEWLTSSGGLRGETRLDTAAPFSIVPYTLWHDNALSWQVLGHQLLNLGGTPLPRTLAWQVLHAAVRHPDG
jgi:hypothetical protein